MVYIPRAKNGDDYQVWNNNYPQSSLLYLTNTIEIIYHKVCWIVLPKMSSTLCWCFLILCRTCWLQSILKYQTQWKTLNPNSRTCSRSSSKHRWETPWNGSYCKESTNFIWKRIMFYLRCQLLHRKTGVALVVRVAGLGSLGPEFEPCQLLN